MNRLAIRVAAWCVSAALPGVAFSTTVWTGAAGNQLWSDPANWSNGLPSFINTAQIANATVDLGGGQASDSLLVLGDVHLINGTLESRAVRPATLTASAVLDAQLKAPTGQVLSLSATSGSLRFNGQFVPFGGQVNLNGVTLGSANPYSEAVSLNAVTITDAGTIASKSVSFANELRLDNAATAIDNRLASDAVLIGGGRLRLVGNSSSPVVQNIGGFASANTVNTVAINDAGQNTQLHTSSFAPTEGSLLRIDLSSPKARFTTGSPVETVGGGAGESQRAIVPFAVSGEAATSTTVSQFAVRSFVTYDTTPASGSGASGVVGFRGLRDDEYLNSLAAATTADNVLLSGPVPGLTASLSINALAMSSSSDLDLGASDLTVVSGAILHRNTSSIDNGSGAVIRSTGGGTLRSGRVMEVFGDNASPGQEIVISAPLDAPSLIALTGRVRLDGVNSIPGGVTSAGALLAIGRPEALGTGTFTMRGNVAFVGNQTISNHLVVRAGVATATGIASTLLTANIEAGRAVTVNEPIELIGNFASTGGGLLRLAGGGVVTGTLGGIGGGSLPSDSRIELAGTFTLAPNLVQVFDGYGEIYGTAVTPMSFHAGFISAGAPNEIGTLTLGNFAASGIESTRTATIRVEVNATSADKLIVNRQRPLGGSNSNIDYVLSLNVLDAVPFGSVFTIIQNDTAQAALLKNFQGITQNALVTAPGGQQFRVSYIGGDGNDVTLTAVPEPATIGMICGASLVLARRRRSASVA